MSSPIFYYESIEGADLTIDSLDEDAAQPIENLQDRSHNLKWKAGNANTTGYIQIDLGAQRTCDTLILGAHNYSSTSVGIKLEVDSGDDPGFGSGLILVGGAFAYEDYEAADADIWMETFAQATKRYWRLHLEAMGSSTYQEIGTIFLGSAFELPVRMTQPWQKGFGVNVSERQTLGGQTYTNKHSAVRRIWRFGFDQLEGQTPFDNMETFLQDNYLNHHPFYFDPDGDGTEYLVRMKNNPFFQAEARYLIHDTDIFEIVEEL